MPIILIIFLNIIRGYKFDFNRRLIASGVGLGQFAGPLGRASPVSVNL